MYAMYWTLVLKFKQIKNSNTKKLQFLGSLLHVNVIASACNLNIVPERPGKLPASHKLHFLLLARIAMIVSYLQDIFKSIK